MSAFEIRGVVLTEERAKLFKENYTGKDWRESLVEGMNFILKESKQKRLSEKERLAFYKWMADHLK